MHSTLSCLLHPASGGIVDDTVITRLGPESFYFVTNAARRDADIDYLTNQIRRWARRAGVGRIDWEVLPPWGLIALQGPLSASILKPLLFDDEADLSTLYFGRSRLMQFQLPAFTVPGARSDKPVTTAPIHVTRGGYTGEDGFELSVPPQLSRPIAEALLHTAGPDKLRLAGLGARDSLRLEAGLCLYGHDLTDTTTPVEASLGWIVGKDRRMERSGDAAFLGADVILSQLEAQAISSHAGSSQAGSAVLTKKRVGLMVEDGAPARQGAAIVAADDDAVVLGQVTSGGPSPSLGKNIAMGYVAFGHHRVGTKLAVLVRGKTREAVVTKMPFVPTKYWKAAGPS
ncbi:MAG: Aminomethyltransferase, mitochondrial [Phylliscum demangeonii]|nr:MAG: Aminomethyltransferase, mitochondrial [Phylliscum demangeonii]